MTDSIAMGAHASDGSGGGLRLAVDPASEVVVGMSDVLQNEVALDPSLLAFIAGCGAIA